MSVRWGNSLQFFFCTIYWILYFSILSNNKIVDLLVYFRWKIQKKIFQRMRRRYFFSVLEKVCFKIQLHSFNWYTYCYYCTILWGSCSCVKIIVYKGTFQWVQHVFVKYFFFGVDTPIPAFNHTSPSDEPIAPHGTTIKILEKAEFQLCAFEPNRGIMKSVLKLQQFFVNRKYNSSFR